MIPLARTSSKRCPDTQRGTSPSQTARRATGSERQSQNGLATHCAKWKSLRSTLPVNMDNNVTPVLVVCGPCS